MHEVGGVDEVFLTSLALRCRTEGWGGTAVEERGESSSFYAEVASLQRLSF